MIVLPPLPSKCPQNLPFRSVAYLQVKHWLGVFLNLFTLILNALLLLRERLPISRWVLDITQNYNRSPYGTDVLLEDRMYDICLAEGPALFKCLPPPPQDPGSPPSRFGCPEAESCFQGCHKGQPVVCYDNSGENQKWKRPGQARS